MNEEYDLIIDTSFHEFEHHIFEADNNDEAKKMVPHIIKKRRMERWDQGARVRQLLKLVKNTTGIEIPLNQ